MVIPFCWVWTEQPVDLAAVQQQLSFSERVVVAVTSGEILRDMAVYQPSLAKANFGIGLAKGALAFAQGFDLGADQDHASFQAVKRW